MMEEENKPLKTLRQELIESRLEDTKKIKQVAKTSLHKFTMSFNSKDITSCLIILQDHYYDTEPIKYDELRDNLKDLFHIELKRIHTSIKYLLVNKCIEEYFYFNSVNPKPSSRYKYRNYDENMILGDDLNYYSSKGHKKYRSYRITNKGLKLLKVINDLRDLNLISQPYLYTAQKR